MAKRETYHAAIKCDCGNTGQAQYREVENPAHNNWNLDTKILMVPKGFSIIQGDIVCDCGNTH